MADGEMGAGREILPGAGEWEGWELVRGGDPFEDLAGPFYMRKDPDGAWRTGLRVEPKHMNGYGSLHGGCLMTMADFALFAIAREQLRDHDSVTVSLNGEFVGPGRLGDLVEAVGEVVREGRSMIFLRGLITCNGAPLLSFSGLGKKIAARKG
jgi:uncharacterized protein (TIGR00369 family)